MSQYAGSDVEQPITELEALGGIVEEQTRLFVDLYWLTMAVVDAVDEIVLAVTTEFFFNPPGLSGKLLHYLVSPLPVSCLQEYFTGTGHGVEAPCPETPARALFDGDIHRHTKCDGA